MSHAFRAASSQAPFDAYLLFNDDVDLFEVQVPGFYSTYKRLNASRPSILVGACVNLHGDVTYSGFRLGSPRRVLDLKRVEPSDSPVLCDTFNANFVLIPGRFFEEVGGLDPAYSHSYGDIDLGLVARKHRVPSFVHETPIGECENNVPLDVKIRLGGLGERWKLLFRHPYGLGPYFHFVWKHRPRWAFPLISTLQLLKRLLLLAGVSR